MRKTLIFGLLTILAIGATPFDGAEPFPEPRPQTGPQASQALAGHGAGGCLTLELQRLATGRNRASTTTQRRAAAWFGRSVAIAQRGPTKTSYGIDFSTARGAAVRLDALPRVERERRLRLIAEGVLAARRSLTSAGFPEINVPVVLARLGPAADGYALGATAHRSAAIVIDVDAAIDELLRSSAHQYAHSVALALSADMPPVWSEALAVWTTQRALGQERDREFRAIDERLSRMHEGLASDRPGHAVGNAVWLTFLESRWGVSAVSATIEELGRGGEIADALDRGVRRVSTAGLSDAFAEFQVWSLFTGSRDDGRHLRGADRLRAPRFTSVATSLPTLSIRQDPALAPWGWSRVRLLESAAGSGGLRVDFEGDLSARWQADLVLTSDHGAIHRVPLAIEDGRVELTVPLDGLAEALLLVRRVDGVDAGPKGYSYSAHREAGYPFELTQMSVEPIADRGLLVQWETTHEHRVVAFNVLRARAEGGPRTRVNPVWIPALGSADRGVGYRFVDAGAQPGVRYEYTIQAVTETGLTSHSRSRTAPRH